ncbi:hypothetical protein T484DRAFT_1922257, partial [Baffinella frigidus]
MAEDVRSSMASTFSAASVVPSSHAVLRSQERNIDDATIQRTKVRGCLSLAINCKGEDDVDLAKAEICEWAVRLKQAFGEFQMEESEVRVTGGAELRVEVKLRGSEKKGPPLKRWLKEQGYFWQEERAHRVQFSHEQVVVVEGRIGRAEVGIVTVFSRDVPEAERPRWAPSEKSVAFWRSMEEADSGGGRSSLVHPREVASSVVHPRQSSRAPASLDPCPDSSEGVDSRGAFADGVSLPAPSCRDSPGGHGGASHGADTPASPGVDAPEEELDLGGERRGSAVDDRRARASLGSGAGSGQQRLISAGAGDDARLDQACSAVMRGGDARLDAYRLSTSPSLEDRHSASLSLDRHS